MAERCGEFPQVLVTANVDVEDRSLEGDLDTTSLGLVMRHDMDKKYFAGFLGYSMHDIETQRAAGFGNATADYGRRHHQPRPQNSATASAEPHK